MLHSVAHATLSLRCIKGSREKSCNEQVLNFRHRLGVPDRSAACEHLPLLRPRQPGTAEHVACVLRRADGTLWVFQLEVRVQLLQVVQRLVHQLLELPPPLPVGLVRVVARRERVVQRAPRLRRVHVALEAVDADSDPSQRFIGGETAARAHAESYFSGKLPHTYKQVRNELDGWDNSSKFSVSFKIPFK